MLPRRLDVLVMNVNYLRVAIPPFRSPGLRVALGGEPIMNDQSLLAALNDNTISTKSEKRFFEFFAPDYLFTPFLIFHTPTV